MPIARQGERIGKFVHPAGERDEAIVAQDIRLGGWCAPPSTGAT